jgi:hypothetical protein
MDDADIGPFVPGKNNQGDINLQKIVQWGWLYWILQYTYCPLGSENPTPCPPGTYLNDIGLYDLNHCTPCKGGYACEVFGLFEDAPPPQ